MNSLVWFRNFHTQQVRKIQHQHQKCGQWSGNVLQIVNRDAL